MLLLKPNVYFAGKEDVSTITSNLPVHVQRLLGALFSTFEVLMDHQRSNHAYLVASIVQCVGQDAYNVQNLVLQMTKDYKSMFSYAYMFNRRTGAHPVSQVQQVSDYFELATQQQQQLLGQDESIVSDRVVNLDEDDDNDSYERLMRTNTSSHFSAPKFGAPIVMPLRPVKLLSDDEHYGSDYQPAIASDLETDLTYDSQRRQDVNHGQMQDDSMFSMDGGSILNSYYKYNGWNNAVEEDEDSDTDYYAPPVVEPVRLKRMTRMRQLATSRSADNNDGDSANKGPGVHIKKKGKKTKLKKNPNNTGGKANAVDTQPTLPWASMGNKGLLSDESDDSNDDEESDFSESETLPLSAQQHQVQQQAARQNYHPPSTATVAEKASPPSRFVTRAQPPAPSVVQKFSDEVEDFEMEEDAPLPSSRTVAVHSSKPSVAVPGPSAYSNRRPEPEASSPGGTSGNSSFELSDREKRHRNESKRHRKNEESPPSRADAPFSGGWRTADPHPAASKSNPTKSSSSGGRMRSVLSDDESEEEEVVTSVRPLHAPLPGAKDTARSTNPLDASIEMPTFGRYANKSDNSMTKNPLDQSIEMPRKESKSEFGRRDDWSEKRQDTERVNAERAAPVAHQTAPPSNRSVVRLPTAKPSKPLNTTEGPGVDLVEDWDSQLSENEEEEKHAAPVKTASRTEPTPSSSSVGTWSSRESKPAAPSPSVMAPQPVRLEHLHEHQEDPHHKLSPDLAAPPRQSSRDPPQNKFVADSPEKGSNDDRKAGLERMRENILKSKREKERAAGHNADSPIRYSPSLVGPPKFGYASEIAPRYTDPQPVSILRKSVTFSDQQAAAPIVPTHPSTKPSGPAVAVVKVNGRYTIEEAPEPETLQVPHLNAHHHDPHTRQAGAIVSQHAAPSLQGESLHVPHVTHASAPIGISLELPPPLKGAPKQEQLSPKLPPARIATPQASAKGSVPVPPTLAAQPVPPASTRAPSPLVPTLSRVPSEQLLPTRAPTHPMSQSRSDSARDMHVGISGSRQFSSSNLSVNSSISRPVLSLPETFVPPPLSEFALNSGIILEGYLHKKSGTFGLWQKVKKTSTVLIEMVLTDAFFSHFFAAIFCLVGVHHVFLRATDIYACGAIGVGTRGGRLEGVYTDSHNRSSGVCGSALCQGKRIHNQISPSCEQGVAQGEQLDDNFFTRRDRWGQCKRCGERVQ